MYTYTFMHNICLSAELLNSICKFESMRSNLINRRADWLAAISWAA